MQDSVMQYGEFGFLNFGLVLLGAAVLSVPIARRLGLSAIVAYLIAGIIIGPHGLAAFGTPESIIPISELGVVMLLFLIGLELEFGRLVAMQRAIFGLGAAQLALTAFAIGALGYASGLVDWRGALVAGLALAMSATAIALQILDDRGRAARRARRRTHHAEGRGVYGARRFSCRRAARGIELPARARSRHRTIPWSSAGPVLHGNRHEHRPRYRARQSLADRRRSRIDHSAQGGDRLAIVPRDVRASVGCAARGLG